MLANETLMDNVPLASSRVLVQHLQGDLALAAQAGGLCLLVAAIVVEIAILASYALRCCHCATRLLQNLYTKLQPQLLVDFREGRFYNPFAKASTVVYDQACFTELSEAIELSQRAAYDDIFNFQFTMTSNGVHWDAKSTNAIRTRLFTRAIKTIGRPQMSGLHIPLQKHMLNILRRQVEQQSSGSATIQCASLCRSLVTDSLALYFFGHQLVSRPDFSDAIHDYYSQTMRCMALLPMLPKFLKSHAYRYLTEDNRSLNVIIQHAQDALASGNHRSEHLKPALEDTLLYTMHEASKDSAYWSTLSILHALLGIWFAASHQPWINMHFVLLELCQRPEYITMIRDEISRHGLTFEGIDKLCVLESFIKESVRLNPLDKVAVRRKALRDFRFKNGDYQLKRGDIACIPAWDLMHNPQIYPKPDEFHGLRFLDADLHKGDSDLCEASAHFPIWGIGSKSCPGRWHSAYVIKMALALLIDKYDIELQRPGVRFKWHYNTFQLPYETTEIVLRRREL